MPACARAGVYVPRQTHDCDAAPSSLRATAGAHRAAADALALAEVEAWLRQHAD